MAYKSGGTYVGHRSIGTNLDHRMRVNFFFISSNFSYFRSFRVLWKVKDFFDSNKHFNASKPIEMKVDLLSCPNQLVFFSHDISEAGSYLLIQNTDSNKYFNASKPIEMKVDLLSCPNISLNF